jgi:hypothetical protein
MGISSANDHHHVAFIAWVTVVKVRALTKRQPAYGFALDGF